MKPLDVRLWKLYRMKSKNGRFSIKGRPVNCRKQLRACRNTLRHDSAKLQMRSPQKLVFPTFFSTFDFAETVSSPIDRTLADFDDWAQPRDHPQNENRNLLPVDGI